MKKNLAVLTLTFLILLTFCNSAMADNYLNRDRYFDNGTTYWYITYPSWNDCPNGDPAYNHAYIYGGYGYLKTKDDYGNDWSDTVLIQGKKVHEGGYYNGLPLPYVLEKNWDELQYIDIIVSVRIKVAETPIVTYPARWNPTVSPAPDVAGFFVLAFFEYYYYDRTTGTYQWSNINNPNRNDGVPDCVVIEMANRWCNDLGLQSAWYQVSGSDIRFNFLTKQTTHDSDLHYIKAGWTVTVGQWTDLTCDIADLAYTAIANFRYWYDRGYINHKIEKVRLTTLAVTTECYLADIRVYIDYAIFWTDG